MALDLANADLESVLDAQAQSWESGECASVESIFELRPELLEDEDCAIELIYHEYLLRRNRGDSASGQEYADRFPRYAEALSKQFAVDEALRGIESTRTNFSSRVRKLAPSLIAGESAAYPELADYEVIERIGQGGMGVVYKAYEPSLNRMVAVKAIRAEKTGDDDLVRRFEREAVALARLEHENIVRIHRVFVSGETRFIALEYVDGTDLGKRMAGVPQGFAESAQTLKTLASAVALAHEEGVIHRDLKPSNVLVTSDGRLKVTDFGLAKLLDDDSSETRQGMAMGSPSYMAPEQAKGETDRIGPGSDVYSLGAILYEMLVGQPPFRGATGEETRRMVIDDEPVPPSQRRKGVPKDLETICLKCLEKEISRRYASARALAEDLGRFLENRPIVARPAGPWGRFARWTQRNPRVAVLSLSLAGLMVTSSILSSYLALRADTALRGQRKATALAKNERQRAESEAKIAAAVNAFLRDDLLSQAGIYSQFFGRARPDPHLEVRTALDRCSEKIGDRFKDAPLVEAAIRRTIGETYHELGLLSAALPHLQKSLEINRAERGKNDPETYKAMLSLGSLHLEDRRNEEASAFLAPALDGLRKTLGPRDPQTLLAMECLCQLYLNDKRPLPEAEKLIRFVYDARLKSLGPADLKTLDAMQGLAVVLHTEGKSIEAKEIVDTVVQRLKTVLDPDHPDWLMVMEARADILKNLGEIEASDRIYDELLERRKKVLSDNHPETLRTMAAISAGRAGRAEPKKALELAGHAIAGGRAALDSNNEILAVLLIGRAAYFSQLKQWDKVESPLKQARRIFQARNGPFCDDVLITNRLLGRLLFFQGRYAECEACFRHNMRHPVRRSETAGVRAEDELMCAACLLTQGQGAEASSLLISAYNGLKPQDAPGLPADLKSPWRIVDKLLELRDPSGQPLPNEGLHYFRVNPILQGIRMDLKFPSNPFHP